MRISAVMLSACAALGVACGAMAQKAPPTVRLEYKFRPGLELIYKIAGTFKTTGGPHGATDGVVSGTERFVVGEADGETLLIGQLPAVKVAIKTNTPSGEQSRSRMFDQASICRMDRTGSPIVRTLKNEEALPRFMPMLLGRFEHRQLDSLPMPAVPVAVGSTWQGPTEVHLQGFPVPVPVQAVSTFAEIKTVEKHRCALIQSKLSPGDQVIAGMPGMALSGEMETLFDLDGGYARSVAGKFAMKISESGETISVTAEMTSTIGSVKTLPRPEAAREARVIKAFDAAVANLYDGEYDKAGAALEEIKPEETPETWKGGIQSALAAVKQLQQMSNRPKSTPPAE